MITIIKYSIFTITLLFAMYSCTEQRDLYVSPYPLLLIKSDWQPSQINTVNGATSMIYSDCKAITELMADAKQKIIRLDKGFYDVIIFNGLMYSPKETHLDNIRYQNINNFEIFEAYVTPLSTAAIFRSRVGENIVDFPDILATRSTAGLEMKNRKKFELKYRDGENGFVTSNDFIADSILLSPCRVTHTCQIIARVHNANSARIVQASLRGFSGSVFLANRLPSNSNVTHQFRLNSVIFDQPDPKVGTISSPVFNTFGPPLDVPSRRYELEINVLLTNSQEYPKMIFDITNQVEKIIEYLAAERLKNTPITNTFYIFIEYELPAIVSDGLDVGVADWGNDVIVNVPIKFK